MVSVSTVPCLLGNITDVQVDDCRDEIPLTSTVHLREKIKCFFFPRSALSMKCATLRENVPPGQKNSRISGESLLSLGPMWCGVKGRVCTRRELVADSFGLIFSDLSKCVAFCECQWRIFFPPTLNVCRLAGAKGISVTMASLSP